MIQWLKNIFSPKAQTSGLSDPESWLVNAMGGMPTAAGTTVSEESALRYVDVLACVMLISKVRASLKPQVYKKRKSGGADQAYDHYLNGILQLEVNPEVIGFSFRETEQAYLLLWGNAYSEIARNLYTGKVLGLYPVHPGRVTMYRESQGAKVPMGTRSDYRSGNIRYQWSDDDGLMVDRASADMLHIAGFGTNGLVGRSVIGLARELIGLGVAVESFGARYFGAGTHPSAIVEHPKTLSEPAAKRLKSSLSEKYAGLGNSHRLLVLEDGMKFQSIGMPAGDAQFIQTRQLNREQVCSLFGVPPHMIAALERATFNNIEVMDSGFVTRGIVPWLERIEDYYTSKLLSARERRAGFEIRHDTGNLLRGDFKTRSEGYQSGIYAGWMSRNEAREREGLNPVEGLDKFLVPVNMMDSDDVGQAVEALEQAGAPAASGDEI